MEPQRDTNVTAARYHDSSSLENKSLLLVSSESIYESLHIVLLISKRSYHQVFGYYIDVHRVIGVDRSEIRILQRDMCARRMFEEERAIEIASIFDLRE